MTFLALTVLMTLSAMAQHTIEDIAMRVTLRDDGSARVTEQRHCQMSSEGTEGFITFNDMGDIEVTDLQVTDEEGTEYEVEEKWNVNRSRSEKTGRCGYHRTSRGVELCWGIGRAGERTYYISYTLTNLVKAYDDFDGFNHSFYEAANSPAKAVNVDIQLERDSLTMRNARIWAFGFYGYAGFDSGFAGAMTKGAMRNGESIIIMMQLNKGVLHPVRQMGGSFIEKVKRQAIEGSDYTMMDDSLNANGVKSSLIGGDNSSGHPVQQDADYKSYGNSIDWTLAGSFLVIAGLIGFGFVTKFRERRKAKKERERIFARLSALTGGVKFEDIPYYRNLPLNGGLLLSAATLAKLDSMRTVVGEVSLGVKFGLQQLYNAFVLRMIYKKGIAIATVLDEKGRQRKLFRISEPEPFEGGADITEDFDKAGWMSGELTSSQRNEGKKAYKGQLNDKGVEYQLQQLFYEAAGDDHLLQPDELEDYVKKDPLRWRKFSYALNVLVHGQVKEKLLTEKSASETLGFLRYLKDFSLVAERHLEEVSLWKEYLVYASLYGIDKQVRKDMKKVAPAVANLDSLTAPIEDIQAFEPLSTALAASMLFARNYETKAEREARERRDSYDYSSDSRSSGYGGSSSYSGGGGHSGGGGSGFR